MADLVRSYAREDQAFVRRLVEVLSAEGRDAWVDWEDIAPSAEWMKEIERAIEGADAFCFVVSPASAASTICRAELDRAVESNKRIITVVPQAHPPEPASLPDTIAAADHILVGDERDLAPIVKALTERINTDREWVHAHTRLLIRAREWESKDDDASLLLRGADLDEAETWMASQRKDPSSTASQARLVLRRDGLRRAGSEAW